MLITFDPAHCKMMLVRTVLSLFQEPLAIKYISICRFHLLKFSLIFPLVISNEPGGLNESAISDESNRDESNWGRMFKKQSYIFATQLGRVFSFSSMPCVCLTKNNVVGVTRICVHRCHHVDNMLSRQEWRYLRKSSSMTKHESRVQLHIYSTPREIIHSRPFVTD